MVASAVANSDVDFSSKLSDDVWLRIFSKLAARDLCHACQVSQRFYQLATDSLLWRQKLSRDVNSWSVISYDTYPGAYDEADCSKKDVYLNCAPDGRPAQKVVTWKSLLRLILPYQPTVAMFGPGMESETSGIFRKILMDDTGVFMRVGLTPGEFSGIGSGVKFSLHNRWKFTLTALYSTSYRERRELNHQERFRSSRLFRHQGVVADMPVLTEPVARLCRSVGGFVFVINASQDKPLDEFELARSELQTMTNSAASTVPLLVLSCTLDDATSRRPCIEIVENLQLGQLYRPWQVRDCVVDTLEGVAPAMEWLLRKVQT